jgi:L-ascorbate metabolism protein UlaG (beta-lactamase superfamily)
MLPIGGIGQSTWTMEVDDEIKAVELIDPKLVIPCHYSVPFLWKRKFAIADDARFKSEVEALGKECRILGAGDVATV